MQFGWYEAGLSLGERKQRGHFSTPPALVDQILDACGYTPDANPGRIRLLDPACGSGNFLARAVQRLCVAGHARGLNQRQVRKQVERNIWGLDPDPVACFLAEMQIRLTLEQAYGGEQAPACLHVHQVDSLALPWQPCVDLLVANPPYLAAKNSDLSHYRQAQQRGQMDSYLLFLDLALRVVRPGGWIGLVLPDPVLARANAAPERARLLNEYVLHHIWHLSGVFSAEVGAAVIIGRRARPRKLHQVTWTRTRWRDNLVLSPSAGSGQMVQQVDQALLRRQPGSALRYLLSTEEGQVVERLRGVFGNTRQMRRAGLVPLEQLVDIKRGEEIGRGHAALKPLKQLEEFYPVLRGGIDIHPYVRPESSWGIARSAIHKPIERYQQRKLLVVKSTGHLQAALDTRGYVVLQTLYLLQLRQQEESLETGYFLLALLNSRLLRAYVYHLHTAYKLVQPQIEQGVLAHLPVPWGSSTERQEIIERAMALERACSRSGSVVEWSEQFATLYEVQERAIRTLYALRFPEDV